MLARRAQVGALEQLAALAGVLALAATAVRLALLARAGDALAGLGGAELASVLVMGLRLDGVAIAWVVAAAALAGGVPRPQRARAVGVSTALALAVAVAVHAADLSFFDYYGFRLNHLVLEHGGDAEVLRAIASHHLTAGWVLGTLGAIACARWLQLRLAALFARWGGAALRRAPAGRGAAALALLALTALAARGSLDHRPLNPSAAAVSSNRAANEIAASGAFNLGYLAVQRLGGAAPRLQSSAETPGWPEAVRRVRALLDGQGRFHAGHPNPLLRVIDAAASAERPLNLVIVVLESFTGRLVGALGGRPALSPEFDALAREGLLLSNCYATGERTVRGLEAVLSSFPPLPGLSAVRRPEAARDFATLASVLAPRGYDSLFLYGGQGIFDHMRGFFLGNGFRSFIEESDFDAPDFRGSWGVSDEDLYRRANRELERRWQEGKPFVAALLTVSLHSPWEFPRGRAPALPPDTPVPDGFEREELENFLYADFALGEFVREARALPYFRDTVFVFVGDHGVHLRGRALVPSEEYRVPALFYAPGRIAPGRIETVTSQLDLAPTALGLAGADSLEVPFFGRDLLRAAPGEGFAILVYQTQRYAARRGDRLTIVDEDGELHAHRLAGGEVLPATEPARHREDARDLLAVLEVAETLLESKGYGEPSPARTARAEPEAAASITR